MPAMDHSLLFVGFRTSVVLATGTLLRYSSSSDGAVEKGETKLHYHPGKHPQYPGEEPPLATNKAAGPQGHRGKLAAGGS